jgi:hypothetical protein
MKTTPISISTLTSISTLALTLCFTAICTLSCTPKEDYGSNFELVPGEGATSLSETFESLALDAKACTLNGWSELHVAGNASWKGGGTGGNKYAEISAEAEPNATCETWLVTPALDLENAPNKTLSFSTQCAYWRESSSLEVYLLTKLSADNAVKLAIGEAPDYIRIAKKDDAAGEWIPSGDIDLSPYASLGVAYVAFRYTAQGGADNSATFRIGNVTWGDAAGETPGEASGVATLSENFESFKEGKGNAYMSTQPDSKGWKGVNIQGTLEPDVRLFDDNKYVHISAHRGSITTNDVQEFWLISPGLDVTAAAAKTFSFDVSAGYYNGSTVFEVYVLDGDKPATASKTKLMWSEPHNIPTGAYSAFASSGNIDLSAYGGVKYIGFHYKGNSGSGNSTTYQIDNFVFGEGSVPATPVLKFTSAEAATAMLKDEFTHTFVLEEKNLTGTTSISCGNLPAWLVLDGKTLTGTPPATGKYELNVTAANGSETATQTFAITVVEAPAAGSNLLLNGGFEDFADAVPTSWSIGSGGNNNPVGKIVTGAKEGTFAVKLAASAGGRCDLKQTVSGVVPGATYTISFWYKDNTKGTNKEENQGVRLYSNFLKSDGKAPSGDNSPLQPAKTLDPVSDWSLFTVDIVAPDDATGFNFEIRATKNHSGVVDNCSFVKKP